MKQAERMRDLKLVLTLSFIFLLFSCYANAQLNIQEKPINTEKTSKIILKKDIPVTLIAQKDENYFITTEKHPDLTYNLTIKDFNFLVKKGTGFVKGGNKTNHDMVLTTIKAGDKILWDLNDTIGTNIKNIQFKSLFILQGDGIDYLVFNLTEIDTTTAIYENLMFTPTSNTSNVEYNPIKEVLRIIVFFIFIIIGIFLFYLIVFQKREKYGKQKARLPKMQK